MCALGFVWRLCISLDLTSISVLAPCADLLEKGWGWQRLLPYRGSVDWTVYKGYLKEYCCQNDGEVTALCVNNKPYEDKSFFSRNAGFGVASDYDTLLFAANLVLSCFCKTKLCLIDL